MDNIDDPSSWSTGVFICFSCRKANRGDRLNTFLGSLCLNCIENAYKNSVMSIDLKTWSSAQFLETLEISKKNIGSRLTILWRFKEILPRVTQYNPSDKEQIKRLLIRNLGYVLEHPLAQTVRHAAYEACVDIGKPLIPLLVSMCEPCPWQFYTNTVMALGSIDLHNPQAHKLIKEAAEANNPEISQRAKAILSGQKFSKSNTEKKIQTSITKSLDDLFEINAQAKRIKEKKEQFLQITTFEEKKIKLIIEELYTADALKRIYWKYLRDFFPEDFFQIKGKFSVNKIKKNDLNSILTKVFTDKSMLQTLVNGLSESIKEILYLFVWEGKEWDVEDLEERFKVKIINLSKKYHRGSTENILNDYALFQVRSRYSWNSPYSSYKYYLSLSDQLRKVFKPCLSSPKGYDLAPLDTIDPTDFLYQDQDTILKKIKLYCSYIEQGNLNYSQSTDKLLKSSLIRMAKYCQIEDFYDNKDKKLQYLKTKLIINFLEDWACKAQENPAEFLRQIFLNFFQKTQDNSIDLYEFLYHLKGGYFEYDYEVREAKIKKSLLKLLKTLPLSQWISVENMVQYIIYRDIYIEVIDKTGARGELYFNKKYKTSFGYSYDRASTVKYFTDAVVVPFLKTMMFLFAGFGIVDIAYDFPKNQILQEIGHNYLSVFDGLRYVRLTPLGAFIVGLTKKFNITILEEESAKLFLDPKRLLITIEGKDPLKILSLEKIADKISENCYKVNYQSFLRGCAGKQDINQKISLFHTNIAKNPPQIWKEFLEDVLTKINPLVKKQKMSIFKLQQNKELISLMASDEVLKQSILKAEGYHILIASENIEKVVKRLKEFGYFIDNM